MKILMVLDREFPPDLRVENEIEALSRAGHEIHLACFTRKNAPADETTESCHIHRRAIRDLTYKSSVGALVFPMYFRFWKRFLVDLFAMHSYDAIHIHDLPLLKVGADLKKKYRCSLTADLHENWPAYLRISQHTRSLLGRIMSPDKKWIRYEKEVLQEADHIIVVVEEARERLGGLGLDPGRIHVVSNTLNREHFHAGEASRTGTDRILFYAGGLNYHRGLQDVIRALALVKDALPAFKCWILGTGSYKKDLETLTAELGLGDRVLFHGWVPYDKMTEKLMRADFALIPHLKSDHTDSTIPHKLFQYMYAGKPVIASDCAPIQRIVRETGSGKVYPSGDPEALALLLRQLEQKDYREMSANGKKWVDQKYNWEADAKNLIDIYTSNSTKEK
jgi:glycosyltransferase involved in cell wall biosynthesis